MLFWWCQMWYFNLFRPIFVFYSKPLRLGLRLGSFVVGFVLLFFFLICFPLEGLFQEVNI